MRICLFEDEAVAGLQPLTLTRPAFDLRCGASSLLQQHCRYFSAAETGALVRPVLAEVCRWTHPEMAVNDAGWLRLGATVLVNARWLPPAGLAPTGLTEPRVARVGDQIAYVVLPSGTLVDSTAEELAHRLSHWETELPQGPAGGRMIDYPWNLVEHNEELLCQLGTLHDANGSGYQPPGLTLIGPAERLWVDPTAEIEPLVVADTRHGPVIIERNARVCAFSRLQGPCYIGPETWILGAKVSGSSIGPVCRIGGEVEESILHGYSNKAHEGFLGHSYVGEWVNMGAGTQVSDLRNDYQPIAMPVGGERLDTGLTKVGAFIGDHSKTGINALVNTGTLVGVFSQILPSGSLPPRVIPSFCRFNRGQLEEEGDPRQLVVTAATVMRRRGQELSCAHIDLFHALFEQTAAQREESIRDYQLKHLLPGAIPVR